MIEIRQQNISAYPDVFSAATVEALNILCAFESDRRTLMARRIARRNERAASRRHIEFLDPGAVVAPRTLQDARTVLELLPEFRIHRFRSAIHRFLRDPPQFAHLVDERMLSRKVVPPATGAPWSAERDE